MSKDRIFEVDILARRYGALPSDIKNLSAADYQFNQLVASTSIVEEARQIKKQGKAKPGRSGDRQKVTYHQVET